MGSSALPEKRARGTQPAARIGLTAVATPVRTDMPPSKRSRVVAGGKHKSAEQMELPSIEACALGLAGSQGRTQMQVLYTCKQQIDGKHARGELDYNAHTKQTHTQ